MPAQFMGNSIQSSEASLHGPSGGGFGRAMGPAKPGMNLGGPAGPQGGLIHDGERPTADFASGAGGIRGGGMMSRPMGGGMAARMGGQLSGPGKPGGFSPRATD